MCLLLLPILYITASIEGKALAVVSQVLTEPRGLQHHCKNCLRLEYSHLARKKKNP